MCLLCISMPLCLFFVMYLGLEIKKIQSKQRNNQTGVVQHINAVASVYVYIG